MLETYKKNQISNNYEPNAAQLIFSPSQVLNTSCVSLLPGDNRNPQAQVYPFDKEALQGHDYNFSCQVPGNGISIKWLKDGVDIPSYQTYRQPNKMIRGLNFNEDIVMLKKVSRADIGNYTCVVTTTQNPNYSNKVTARLLSVKGMSADRVTGQTLQITNLFRWNN